MAEEARAAARHNWPEPLQLERRNLLTARRRWLRRTLQVGGRRGGMRRWQQLLLR